MTNKVTAQEHFETIPPQIEIESDCAKCQMKEVENQRLKNLMQGWDKTENEIRIDELESLKKLTRWSYSNGLVLYASEIDERIKELSDAK